MWGAKGVLVDAWCCKMLVGDNIGGCVCKTHDVGGGGGWWGGAGKLGFRAYTPAPPPARRPATGGGTKIYSLQVGVGNSRCHILVSKGTPWRAPPTHNLSKGVSSLTYKPIPVMSRAMPCCAALFPQGTCSRDEMVPVFLIGQLGIPLLNAAHTQAQQWCLQSDKQTEPYAVSWCCGLLCQPGTCSRAELVQVSLIGQLVIPLLNAAGQQGGEGVPPSPLLSLELCEAFTAAAFRPQDTVLFGE